MGIEVSYLAWNQKNYFFAKKQIKVQIIDHSKNTNSIDPKTRFRTTLEQYLSSKVIFWPVYDYLALGLTRGQKPSSMLKGITSLEVDSGQAVKLIANFI